MLREARIVMPYDNDDEDSHAGLRTALLDAFGGYTCTTGVGAWRDDFRRSIIDRVQVYDVAIEAERDATWDTLFQIAMKAGRELDQEAVYIRYPDGSVCIEPVHGREGLGGLMPPTKENGGVKDAPSVAEAAPQVPLGGRRLPAVGEIWETSCGDKVAIVRSLNRVIGRFDVVVLSSGPYSPFGAGLSYEVDEDGKVLTDKSSHPRDLKRFVKDF